MNASNCRARLIQLVPPREPIVVQANDVVLELDAAKYYALRKVYSVVDSHGITVRSVHEWLSQLNKEVGVSRADGTVEQYGKALSYLVRWIEEKAPYTNLDVEQSIARLKRDDLLRWIRYMKDLGAKSRKTLRLREAAVKEFLLWLTTVDGGKRRQEDDSPYGRDGMLKGIVKGSNPKSPKYLPPSLIGDVLNGLNNECERCMFHFQYDTGLRISELIGLKISDIPEISNISSSYEFIPLYVRGVKGVAGDSKERVTLVSRAVLKRLQKYHSSKEYKLAQGWDIDDPDKPAFLTVNSLPWTLRNASKQFKKAIRRSSVNDDFSTHWLRHGTAFSILRSDMGKDYQDKMLILMGMLGHNSVKTSQIYTQVSPAMLAEFTKVGEETDRLNEAEQIRLKTYLAPLKHKEKRGHFANK